MNYLLIPFFVILITIFHGYLKQHICHKRMRENSCVMWCITLLFSLLGAIISYHMYHYELTAPLSWGLMAILLLYLILTLLFVAVSPSGYRRLFHRRTPSEEEILYAEYRYNHSLEMLRDFFLALLLIVPILYYGYQYIKDKLKVPLLLEEAYLIGGLYFVTFCILFPMSMRQSIFWLRQLQRIPEEYEMNLLRDEEQVTRYGIKNRRI